jgi:hypothetical protein
LGGLGSLPEKARDPIQPTIDILNSTRDMMKKYHDA